jgi:hypothetical protein
MPTSVRLDARTEALLARLARTRGRTKSEVIREALERLAEAETRNGSGPTLYDRIKHLVGKAGGGPPDLSERTGEKFTKLLRAQQRRRRR